MVTAHRQDGALHCWVLQPTRSLDWAQAKLLILGVSAVSLAIGGFFLHFGYPLVLPFSGLEALAVAAAFYVVLRDGERREVVRLEGEQLVIESGTRVPSARQVFNRHWVKVELATSRYRYHPTRLLVGAHGRQVELGRFLSDGEREIFSRELINALSKNR
jgi:uncharacterized membrane protein